MWQKQMNSEINNTENECWYSIVIATFNSEEYLTQCLESIHKVFGWDTRVQIIIKDGNSSDKTIEIASTWYGKINMNILVDNDVGIYDAWNQALDMVKGKWVSFLGSDDLFVFPDKERLFEILSKNDEQLITFPVLFSSNNIKIKNNNEIDFTFEQFKTRMLFAHPGMLHNSNIFDEFRFDQKFRIAGDYEFLLRYLDYSKFNKISSHKNEDCIVQFNDGGVSSNSKYKIKLLKEILKIRRIHSLKMIDRFVTRLTIHVVLNKFFGTTGDLMYALLLRLYLKIKRDNND